MGTIPEAISRSPRMHGPVAYSNRTGSPSVELVKAGGRRVLFGSPQTAKEGGEDTGPSHLILKHAAQAERGIVADIERLELHRAARRVNEEAAEVGGLGGRAGEVEADRKALTPQRPLPRSATR